MATKKKTEVVETEAEVTTVEPVEEKPKKTSTRKKKVEEPVVEEVKVEEPKVEEPKVEEHEKIPEVKKEEPKKVEKAPKEEEKLGLGHAITTSGVDILRGPSREYIKVGSLTSNTKVIISEISGNWARIGANKWVNINSLKKE